jgi:hypothetical protein
MAQVHEHTLYDHADPRYLVCDCGQYAVRKRTVHGQFSVVLVDPPRRSFGDAADATWVPRFAARSAAQV